MELLLIKSIDMYLVMLITIPMITIISIKAFTNVNGLDFNIALFFCYLTSILLIFSPITFYFEIEQINEIMNNLKYSLNLTYLNLALLIVGIILNWGYELFEGVKTIKPIVYYLLYLFAFLVYLVIIK